MDKRKIERLVGVVITLVLAALAAAGWYFPIDVPEPVTDIGAQALGGMDVTNLGGPLEITQPTTVPTAQPGLQVDNESAVGNSFEVRVAATPQFYVDSSGAATSQSGLTVTSGGLTVTAGGLDFDAGGFTPSFADLTVTDGTTPTLTSMIYALDAAAEVTITLAACTTEGEVRILIADDTGPINVNDTNVRTHDGAALALGANDAALMVCQDTEWVVLLEAALQ